MVSEFFASNPDVLEFTLRLNVTQTVFNGRKNVSASGLSSLKILGRNSNHLLRKQSKHTQRL